MIETSIVCGTVLLSILSILTYFAKFHESRKFEQIDQLINTCEQRIAKNEDDLRKVDNKIRFS